MSIIHLLGPSQFFGRIVWHQRWIAAHFCDIYKDALNIEL